MTDKVLSRPDSSIANSNEHDQTLEKASNQILRFVYLCGGLSMRAVLYLNTTSRCICLIGFRKDRRAVACVFRKKLFAVYSVHLFIKIGS